MAHRQRGEGSLYQPTYTGSDGKKRQSAVWWIRYYRAGRRLSESTGQTNRQKASTILSQRLADVSRGKLVGPDLERVTFAELVAAVEADYEANGRRSLKRLQQSLAHLRDAFGDLRALHVTEDRITRYTAARLKAGAMPATVNRELAALKRAFRLGERAGRVARRPYIALLAEHNARTGFFEWEQFQAVLAKLPADLQALAQVAYITGWRVASELRTRTWSAVDFGPAFWPCRCKPEQGRKPKPCTADACARCGAARPGWLRLEPGEGKAREGRQFPMGPELRAALKRQRERTDAMERYLGQPVPWVFWRSKGPGVAQDGQQVGLFRRAWLTACEAAGLEGRIPHDFRRTAVRNLERAGVPRSTAMAMVGHKTESMYRRYAIVDEAMLTEGGEKLSTLHQGQGGEVVKGKFGARRRR